MLTATLPSSRLDHVGAILRSMFKRRLFFFLLVTILPKCEPLNFGWSAKMWSTGKVLKRFTSTEGQMDRQFGIIDGERHKFKSFFLGRAISEAADYSLFFFGTILTSFLTSSFHQYYFWMWTISINSSCANDELNFLAKSYGLNFMILYAKLVWFEPRWEN